MSALTTSTSKVTGLLVLQLYVIWEIATVKPLE